MVGLASSLDMTLTLAPGSELGRYRVLQRLAIGGMAELHLARITDSTDPDPFVVIKRVLPHLALDPDFVRLFRREAEVSALLHHPNIIEVIEVAQIGDELFYVMRFVHGLDVRAILKELSESQEIPPAVSLSIVAAAARGLHHAHEQRGMDGHPLGLVHRDVSPSNILVGYDGVVKVTDFGIAKAAARTEKTRGSMMKGKIGYMSPEQCQGTRIDRRSDVHGLGILLYELTTHCRLFDAGGDFAVLAKIVSGDYDPPSTRRPDYPADLEAIVDRALQVEPDDRYATAAEFGRAVEDFAAYRGLELGPHVVATYLRARFGHPASPVTEFMGASSSMLSMSAMSRSGIVPVASGDRRWRVMLPIAVVVALAGGVGVGLSLNTATATEPPPASQPGPQPQPSPVVAAESEPALEPEPEVLIVEVPSTEASESPPPPRLRKKKRRRAKKRSEPQRSKSLFPDGF